MPDEQLAVLKNLARQPTFNSAKLGQARHKGQRVRFEEVRCLSYIHRMAAEGLQLCAIT